MFAFSDACSMVMLTGLPAPSNSMRISSERSRVSSILLSLKVTINVSVSLKYVIFIFPVFNIVERSIEESVVNGVPVLEYHYPEVLVHLGDVLPPPDPPVRLHLLEIGVEERPFHPLEVDFGAVWSAARVFEIFREPHSEYACLAFESLKKVSIMLNSTFWVRETPLLHAKSA